ncbi:MAG: hypothetical protein A2096_14970 [Spirochaetes bacterium GWF1_41_5]|nr:MAG: hypothetical protein A2096_14970 [Spirochaetes bacterium GWF1_41_5]HBE04214.1 hypothetical protein [Spirochaetia bacterium]
MIFRSGNINSGEKKNLLALFYRCFSGSYYTKTLAKDIRTHLLEKQLLPLLQKFPERCLFFQKNTEITAALIYAKNCNFSHFIEHSGKQKYGSLLYLCTDEKYRRRRLASRLVREAEKIFRSETIGSCHVSAELANHTAVSFYESLGYKKIQIICQAQKILSGDSGKIMNIFRHNKTYTAREIRCGRPWLIMHIAENSIPVSAEDFKDCVLAEVSFKKKNEMAAALLAENGFTAVNETVMFEKNLKNK